MSRWLAYANPDLSPDSLTTLTIDTRKEGESLRSTTSGGQTVSIVKLSGGVSEEDGVGTSRSTSPDNSSPKLAFTADDDELAFAAITKGDQTYGAVSMTTHMGASRAYRAVERLKSAGRIRQARDGTLKVVGARQ